MSLGFTACSSDDDEPENPQNDISQFANPTMADEAARFTITDADAPCLLYTSKDGFLFFDTLMPFFVSLVVSVLNLGKFFGHVLLGEVNQQC